MSISTNEYLVNLSISFKSSLAPSVSGVLVILKMGGGLLLDLFFLLFLIPIAFLISEFLVSGFKCGLMVSCM